MKNYEVLSQNQQNKVFKFSFFLPHKEASGEMPEGDLCARPQRKTPMNGGVRAWDENMRRACMGRDA